MGKRIKLAHHHKRFGIKFTHKWVGIWALSMFMAVVVGLIILVEHEAVVQAIGRDGFALVSGVLGAFIILSAGVTGRMLGHLDQLASDKRRFHSRECYLKHHLDALESGTTAKPPHSQQSPRHYHYEYGEEDFTEWEYLKALHEEQKAADVQDALDRHNR